MPRRAQPPAKAQQTKKGNRSKAAGSRTGMKRSPEKAAGNTPYAHNGRTETVKVGKKEYVIPVDKNGYVPHEILVQHYFDIFAGARKRYRKPNIDSNTDAKHTFTGKKFKPEDIKQWWAHPNRYDIEGVDTSGTVGVSFFLKGREDNTGPFTIVNATPDQAKLIRKHIGDNFTPEEIALGSGGKGKLKVIVAKPTPQAAGAFAYEMNVIAVDPNFLKNPSTSVHEFIHNVKFKDGSRTGTITRSHITEDDDLMEDNLEEASTVAETFARLSPMTYGHNSYYGHLSEKSEDITKLIESDRKLFAGNSKAGSKGLIGKAAIDSVEANFAKSNIGNLKWRGKMTAKDYAKMLKKIK